MPANSKPYPALRADDAAQRRATWLAGLTIVVATCTAYANTFQAPFLFDDLPSIVDNPTIRRLWPPGDALSPPPDWGFTVSGRPVLNFSLALNYAISGLNVWSYHAFNLVIHVLAGLTLFGLVRRTCTQPVLAARHGARATWFAFVVTLLWVVHPLQTESVTYVVQRAESLMGLCFLLALYAFVRATSSTRPRAWQVISFLACLLGVGTKEVTALVPVLVLLYDRTFASGSFRAAWRRHRWHHLALAATWLPLAWLLAGTGGNRGGTVGFDVGVSWSAFWLTQFEAVTRYLMLAFWPHPLIFDYGKVTATGGLAGVLWAIPVVTLAALTLVALRRWPVAGFLGAWFFAILAPTSIVPGAIQMIVEHRMYLPLAAVIAAVVSVAATNIGRRPLIGATAILALAAIAATLRRNADYADPQTMWNVTVADRPANARAHNNLGRFLYEQNRLDDAIPRFRESLRLDPTIAHTHHNLGLALMRAGQLPEAAASLAEAVRILPYYASAHLNLGIVLTQLDHADAALPHFNVALRFDPAPAEAHFRFGVALAQLGRWAEAITHYTQAVQLDPAHAQARSNWGAALFRSGDAAAAIVHFEAALRLRPDLGDVHFNLGLALAALGRFDAAATHYTDAVRLRPESTEARLNLGITLGQLGRLPEAIAALTAAVQRQPDDADVHYNLGYALFTAGRTTEARTHFEAAIRLRPDYPAAQQLLRQLP